MFILSDTDVCMIHNTMLTILSKLRWVWVQCHSKNQLTQELDIFIDDLYDVNSTELETTSQGPKASNHSLRSLVIGIGSSQIVMDMLGKSLSQVPSLSFHIY